MASGFSTQGWPEREANTPRENDLTSQNKGSTKISIEELSLGYRGEAEKRARN
jgi:hypothetical protein